MRVGKLGSLSVEELVEMRKEIDGLLAEKLSSAKKELQSKLDYLDGLFGGGTARASRRGGAGRKVEAKFRGPNGESWAGRGMRPRWLTALLNDGHKIEEFAVADTGSRQSNAGAKPGRKRKGTRGRPRAEAA